MMRIAIVEDDPACSKLLLGYLRQYREETGTEYAAKVFRNGVDFLSDYGDGFELVLMDIDMPMMDGLETSRKLRRMDEGVCLIFITNMAQYAINGYEVNALDFIVKPVGYFNFTMKLEKAMRNIDKNKDRAVTLETDNGLIKLKVSEIYYIEGSGHYVIYHTSRGEIKLRATMKETEDKFSREKFMRCSASFLVNFAHVTRIDAGCATVHGDELPISRARRKDFVNALTIYFEGGGIRTGGGQ